MRAPPLKDFGVQYAAAAVVAFLFAASGPVAIILSVGARGGLSESDIASWIFAAFVLNSVISVVFTLRYRQPLIFLWSIPGAVLVGPALAHLSFPEVIGAFLATGVLMLLLGLSGWVRRAAPAFIATLAGLAMLKVLQSAFATSFGGRFSFGALVCFLITVADVAIFRIGAPFWGLVLGLAASRLLERRA